MKILVFNPAAIMGGAIDILNAFLHDVSKDKINIYYIVISDEVQGIAEPNSSNIIFTKIRRNYKSRLKWLYLEMPRYIHANGINTILSLENTCNILYNKVPQYIYLHQSLQFAPLRHLTLRNALKLKIINGFLIKLSCRRAKKIFVQTEWMRQAVKTNIKVLDDRIEVVRPPQMKNSSGTVDDLLLDKIRQLKDKGYFIALAVTGPDKYRLVETLIYFAGLWKKHQIQPLTLILTISGDENGYSQWLKEIAAGVGLNKVEIMFAGRVSKATLSKLYGLSDALMYSSYIETVGLPLLEAMQVGLPIFAPNRPYAKEICANYAFFYECGNPDSLYEIFKLHRCSKPGTGFVYESDSFKKIIDSMNSDISVR